MSPQFQSALDWLKNESAATMRMLKAIPADKFDAKVHEKFKTAGELANHLADCWFTIADALLNGKIPYDLKPEVSTSPADVAQKYQQAMDKLLAVGAGLTDAQINTKLPFIVNGQAVWNPDGLELLRSYICHEIHHRGQLGLMVRLYGGKVPGMYGPTSDDM